MLHSGKAFTLAMYEQNLADIAAISELPAFTDDDYAKLARLDGDLGEIRNSSDYDHTQATPGSFEKIIQRQLIYGEALERAEKQIKKFGNLKYYKWFSFNHHYPRYSDIKTEPDKYYTTKYTCCICNHFTYGDSYGFGAHYFAAYFYNRSKDVILEQCTIKKLKKFEQQPESEEEQEAELDSEKFNKCCLRRYEDSGYEIHHCKNQDHCKCFTIQPRNNMKMLSGRYGSCIADKEDYFYCGPEEKFQDDGLVCDWCINDMVFSGELVYFTGS